MQWLRRLKHDESDDGDSVLLVDFFNKSDAKTCWTFTRHTPFLPSNKQHQSNKAPICTYYMTLCHGFLMGPK